MIVAERHIESGETAGCVGGTVKGPEAEHHVTGDARLSNGTARARLGTHGLSLGN